MLSTVFLAADISIPDAGIAAVLGYIVVFIGLALLMFVIILMGKIMTARSLRSQTDAAGVPAQPDVPKEPQTAEASSAAQIPAAPGSAGQLKLYDVPDREAAMIMAIVADKMGKPLNELRFKSIKEVKEDEKV